MTQKTLEPCKAMMSLPNGWLILQNAWGAYLDTTESLTSATLASFENDSMYNMHWYNGKYVFLDNLQPVLLQRIQ